MQGELNHAALSWVDENRLPLCPESFAGQVGQFSVWVCIQGSPSGTIQENQLFPRPLQIPVRGIFP